MIEFRVRCEATMGELERVFNALVQIPDVEVDGAMRVDQIEEE